MRGALAACMTPRASLHSWCSIRSCSHGQQQVAMEEAAQELVLRYHQETKHGLSRYARGPHGLDWANQPNPFRRYLGATLVPLEHIQPSADDPRYGDVFGEVQSRVVDKRSLSQLFYDSLALSAWKKAGLSTWSLRVNPSSGNLHPTEGYIVCGPVQGVSDSPFVAHYAPKEHGLEMRAQVPEETWSLLSRDLPQGAFFIGLSSIFWREAWKYGERAFRYCNHDVGHAIGSVAIASATMGWRSVVLDAWSTRELHLLLGLPVPSDAAATKSDGTGVERGVLPQLEQEHGDCLMLLLPQSSVVPPANLRPSPELLLRLSELRWDGNANSLSREHVRWKIIYRAAQASEKPSAVDSHLQLSKPVVRPEGDSLYRKVSVREIVQTRRSAVSMDGRYAIQKEAFYHILCKAMPSLSTPGAQDRLPFSALPWKVEVNAALFVHRVVGIERGVYFLIRNPLHEDALRNCMRADFLWEKPQGCPPELPLYLLVEGDCRALSERVSCHQDIASDGCFSLGMVARFEDSIREHGAWMYPRLFWEAGLLGQLLYLEAHALGISATGIGCYFDDAVHDLLGFQDSQFQSLYHFTLGVPVVDSRIMNLPAYPGPEEL